MAKFVHDFVVSNNEDVNALELEVTYDKGNCLNTQRGWYMYANPVKIEKRDGYVTKTTHHGYKWFVFPCQRNSKSAADKAVAFMDANGIALIKEKFPDLVIDFTKEV